MMQQISRARNIDVLNIYIKNNSKELLYNSLEDVKKYNIEMNDNHNKIMLKSNIQYTRLDIIYENLYCYNEYYNGILKSYSKYHLKKLLEDKGFIMEEINDDETSNYNNENINKKLKLNNDDDLKLILKSFEDSKIKLTPKQNNKKEKIKRRMEYLDIKISDLDNFIINLLENDTKFRHHVIICRSFLQEKIFENMYIFYESTEFKENIWNCVYDKIETVHATEKYLGISSYNIKSLADIQILERTDIKNFNIAFDYIQTLFNFKSITIKTNYDVYKYLIKMYESLYGQDMIETINEKRIKTPKGYKKCYRYEINTNYLKQHYMLLKFRNNNVKIIRDEVLALFY